MPDVRVRPATAADDPPLARLDATSWPAALQVAPPTAADQPFFGPRRPVGDVLVAERTGRVVGYAHLAAHSSMAVNAHVLHLNALVVEGTLRRAGVGARLVEAAVEEARRRGKRKLGLRVLSSNAAAVALYERHGFVREGRLRDEFLLADGRYADDLWYALDLTRPDAG